GGLRALEVAFGQAPFDPAGPIDAGDDRHGQTRIRKIDDDATGGDLLHRGSAGRAGSRLGHRCGHSPTLVGEAWKFRVIGSRLAYGGQNLRLLPGGPSTAEIWKKELGGSADRAHPTARQAR